MTKNKDMRLKEPDAVGVKGLNHIAIAVAALDEACDLYEKVLGLRPGPRKSLPEHGVEVAFFSVGLTSIELVAPLGEESPLAGFLKRNPQGGLHHLSFDVDDVAAKGNALRKAGLKLIGEGKPKIGAHGTPVIFVHPRDMNGVLVEFEER